MANALEIAAILTKPAKFPLKLLETFQTNPPDFTTKKADEHYNIIFRFYQVHAGSDVDAALYYLMRMRKRRGRRNLLPDG